MPSIGERFVERMRPAPRGYERYGDREDASRRSWARVFSVLTALTGAGYLAWAASNLDAGNPILSGAFFTAEAISFGLFLLAAGSLGYFRFKPPRGLPVERPADVDVLITVCGEPLNVVRTTLRAALGIRWNHGRLKVHVLDDGGSTEIRELADRLGMIYHSRRSGDCPAPDGKAGNLNFGLSRTSGEFVLILDADQVPKREIVEAMTGYMMRFPRVAFVQSKQNFLVPERDPFNNLDPVFYDGVQLGLDGTDAAISCGSGVLYRRAALEDVGGFATWNVVEDLTTSYELHARGWESFYYPHVLSEGLAPAEVAGVYQQRRQWALDTMRIFFWDNPLFKKGMSWKNRRTYLLIPLTYIVAGLVLPFFFALPAWGYLTGEAPLSGSAAEFLLLRGAYFGAMVLAIHHLFRGRVPGKQFRTLAGLFPVYAWAVVAALIHPKGKGYAYRLNNVDGAAARKRTARTLLAPQLTLIAANALLPLYAIFTGSAPATVTAGYLFVSAFTLWTLWPFTAAALRDDPVWGAACTPEMIYENA